MTRHRIASIYDRSCYRPGAPRTERDPDLDLYRAQVLGTLGIWLLAIAVTLVAFYLRSH